MEVFDKIAKMISVVIPAYNEEKLIGNCLRALIAQKPSSDFEIIVVDNASEDDSADMVKAEFPYVKLIKNCKNLGFAMANNIGIASSVANYLCLINSDVIVDRNCIKKLVQYLKENRNVGMVGPLIKNPDGTVQLSCYGYPTIWNIFCSAMGLHWIFPGSKLFDGKMIYWPHDSVRSVEFLNGCFWCVRREALDSVGMLDENFFMYGEDIDWCKRYRDAGWDVVHYPGAEAIHFGGASSANAPIRFYIEMEKANLQYWEKHHGKFMKYIYNATIYLLQLNRLIAYSVLYILPLKNKEEKLFKIKRSAACLKWLVTGSQR